MAQDHFKTPPNLKMVYKNPNYKTNKVIFHQRYSTNTFPEWKLAQPFRFLAHNGEINTIKGNTNWMKAREMECSSEVWKSDIEKIKPLFLIYFCHDTTLPASNVTTNEFFSIMSFLKFSGCLSKSSMQGIETTFE